MKKCLIILLIFNQLQLKSQDAVFSQINESPVILNPANAGSQYDIRTNLNFRQQWRSVTDPYITIAVSADAKLFSKNSSSSLGLGLFVLNDKAGIAKLNNFKSGLIIAGKVPIASNQNISTGISLAFSQTHIDLSALSWDKQYDGLNYNPDLPSGETFISEKTQNIDSSNFYTNLYSMIFYNLIADYEIENNLDPKHNIQNRTRSLQIHAKICDFGQHLRHNK